MMEIYKLSRIYDFSIIEDGSHAIGGSYKGEKIGSCKYSDITVFSFHPVKIITTGEGGMVLFRDQSVAETARKLRDHGMNPKKRYWHEVIGYNYRLTNLQAAIGVAQMERIDYFVQHKRDLARVYHQELKDIEEIRLPSEAKWAKSSYWLYTVLLNENIGSTKIQLETFNEQINKLKTILGDLGKSYNQDLQIITNHKESLENE